jgi:hypothetical protein
MTKLMKQVGAATAALALVFALAGTASAVTDYATVTGHAASTAENNNPNFWETGDLSECTEIDPGEGGFGAEYTLLASYELVIVKAGSEQSSGDNALTLFANASAGETVWADSNGTEGDGPDEGDKNISHIIVCDEVESSSSSSSSFSSSEESTTDSETTSESETTSFSDSVSSTTTLKDTDTIGGTGSGQQSGGTWLLLAALGVLLGSVLVVAPSRAKTRQ